MLTLKELSQNREELLNYLLANEKNINHLTMNLKGGNKIFALCSFFEEHNLSKAKQYFYVYGLLDAFSIKQFNSGHFTYDLHSIGYAMLSDNLPFIKNDYAHLSFTDFYLEDITEKRIDRTMEDHVLAGEDGCIFVHTVQQFLLGNNDLVERNIGIMENIWFSGKNQNSTMQYDVNFFRALHQKDKSKCETILKEMVSPKIHQKRNDEALLKKYISMPALGYAKIAWILGIEVQVNSKLIPKELLPVEPLEHYDIPYEFLKSEPSKNNLEIKNFTKFNDDGMIIPIKIGFGVNMFDNVSKQEYIDYVNCYSKQSVSWEYEGQKIILADKNVSIKAYPSLDLKYVIAIYEGFEGEYKPPANAVIYNADGSIHTILKMPVLESENILKKINFNKDSNPPIEASSFEGGLLFSNFDWWKNEQGDLINRIQITYDRDWIEWRELDIKTGKVGKYIGQGKF
ncbi:MAG: immunity 49 family protein [Flavobacterium sp.]|nr:immunity 49 family protein [Flavobacterium sp.]